MKEIIYGKVPSKSNSYRAGSYVIYKTHECRNYEKSFAKQCVVYKNKNISVPFELEIDVYYPTRANDLDGSFKIALDCMAMCKAIKNDNLCVKITANKHIDKKNPRIEFILKAA